MPYKWSANSKNLKKKQYTQTDTKISSPDYTTTAVMWKFVCMLQNLPPDVETWLLYIKIVLFIGHAVNEAINVDFKQEQNKIILRLSYCWKTTKAKIKLIFLDLIKSSVLRIHSNIKDGVFAKIVNNFQLFDYCLKKLYVRMRLSSHRMAFFMFL